MSDHTLIDTWQGEITEEIQAFNSHVVDRNVNEPASAGHCERQRYVEFVQSFAGADNFGFLHLRCLLVNSKEFSLKYVD